MTATGWPIEEEIAARARTFRTLDAPEEDPMKLPDDQVRLLDFGTGLIFGAALVLTGVVGASFYAWVIR